MFRSMKDKGQLLTKSFKTRVHEQRHILQEDETGDFKIYKLQFDFKLFITIKLNYYSKFAEIKRVPSH
jgi:hypothetical protein